MPLSHAESKPTYQNCTKSGMYSLHGDDKVFETALFLLFLGRLAVHYTVETSRVLQEIVNTGHNAEDTEGEKIDTDDRDDTGD